MQTQTSNQLPNAEHLDEASDALDAALNARREWKAAAAHAEKLRIRYVSAEQRSSLLAREAAEIEGAAA